MKKIEKLELYKHFGKERSLGDLFGLSILDIENKINEIIDRLNKWQEQSDKFDGVIWVHKKGDKKCRKKKKKS
jgi:hypothetical protein